MRKKKKEEVGEEEGVERWMRGDGSVVMCDFKVVKCLVEMKLDKWVI